MILAVFLSASIGAVGDQSGAAAGPQGLNIKPLPDGSTLVSWEESQPGTYTISRANDGYGGLNGWQKIAVTTSTSFTDTTQDILDNVIVGYRVDAAYADGTGGSSTQYGLIRMPPRAGSLSTADAQGTHAAPGQSIGLHCYPVLIDDIPPSGVVVNAPCYIQEIAPLLPPPLGALLEDCFYTVWNETRSVGPQGSPLPMGTGVPMNGGNDDCVET